MRNIFYIFRNNFQKKIAYFNFAQFSYFAITFKIFINFVPLKNFSFHLHLKGRQICRFIILTIWVFAPPLR